jgi:hypothetical protein
MSFNAWRKLGTTRIRSNDYRLALNDDFGAILREQLLPAEEVASEPVATLSATLAAITVSATGSVAVSGSVTSTLSGLSRTITGTVLVTGQTARALAPVTGASAGAVSVAGQVVATLGDVQSQSEAETELPEEQAGVSGGFLGAWDAWRANSERRKRKEEREAAEIEAIPDPVSREIALELREADRRAELARLADLAEKFPATIDNSRVQAAYTRALERQTLAALEALDRELLRMREEEEFMLLSMLMAA